ncbi:MAG: hypothetical protein KJN90_11800, partial [Gammaproteobacteria bacterium]|nr:hypothetical protein [Gammaproteobacteria bacterium]
DRVSDGRAGIVCASILSTVRDGWSQQTAVIPGYSPLPGGRVVLIAMLPKGGIWHLASGIWHPVFRYAEPLRAAWLVEHAARLIHPVGSAESGTISTN